MDIAAFRESLKADRPPAGLDRPLLALRHAGKGAWDTAHGLVQQNEGEARHDWVHAYLHRVEGDAGNAGYWYRRAGKPAAAGAFDAEWAAIAASLLGAGRDAP
jgi:hypothetical protein